MATTERRWNWAMGPRLATVTGTVASPPPPRRLLAVASALIPFSRRAEPHAGPSHPAQFGLSADAVSNARCTADWRRPDGYWACRRGAGHKGQHRMQGVWKP